MELAGDLVLFVARDDTVVVVSNAPLKLAGGRADTHRWGSVLEISPPESGNLPMIERVAGWSAFWLFVATILPVAAGMAWWPVPLLFSVIAVAVRVFVPWLRQPGVVPVPDPDQRPAGCHLLFDDEDREIFLGAMDLGERAFRTWPLLGDLVDAPVAQRLMAHALFDLAAILERRQGLRELLDLVAERAPEAAEHDGPAARRLQRQEEEITASLTELDSEIDRRIADLTAVAVAGESFIREREMSELARDVDQALVELRPEELPSQQDPGAELADQTEAVLSAYRELNVRYGSAT